MSRFQRVVSAAVVVSALAFATATPAVAGSNNWSPRKLAFKCSKVADKQERSQQRIDRLAARPASSDPVINAERAERLAKFNAHVVTVPQGC